MTIPQVPVDFRLQMNQFAELEEERMQLEERLDELKRQSSVLESSLMDQMAEMGMSQFAIRNRTYYLAQDFVMSRKGGLDNAAVVVALKTCGLDDLIDTEERYKPAELKSRLREMSKDGGIPEEIANVMFIDQPYRIRSRVK